MIYKILAILFAFPLAFVAVGLPIYVVIFYCSYMNLEWIDSDLVVPLLFLVSACIVAATYWGFKLCIYLSRLFYLKYGHNELNEHGINTRGK